MDRREGRRRILRRIGRVDRTGERFGKFRETIFAPEPHVRFEPDRRPGSGCPLTVVPHLLPPHHPKELRSGSALELAEVAAWAWLDRADSDSRRRAPFDSDLHQTLEH